MDVLRPFRCQARWLADRLDGEAQMTLGVLCLNIGLLLFLPLPFAGEPPLIYAMSAGALVYGGLGFIASGQAVLETEHLREATDG